MTRRQYEDLTPPARRRLVTASLLRSGVSVAALLVGYYLAPLDQPLNPGTWIRFTIGLLVFGAVVIWQVRAILGSNTPQLRAIQAAAVGLPLLLVLFASTYIVIAHSAADSFTESLNRTDALYFTVTVFATVGFGDIAPQSEAARIATMIQMIVGLITVGLIAKIVLSAVQVAIRRRDNPTTGDPEWRNGEEPETHRPDGNGPEGG